MTSFAFFRLENELEDIHMLTGTTCKLINSEEEKFICSVVFTIFMSEGIYQGRSLVFILHIPREYPYVSPKIVTKNKIFHPNIDEEGRVCLEILKEGWSCGYGLENIFVNLYCVLLEPSSLNPLNVEAGELLEKDYERFKEKAKSVK